MVDIGSTDDVAACLAKRGPGPRRRSGAGGARGDEGPETVPTFFSAAPAADLKRERGQASIVTANNAFANVDDLSTASGSFTRRTASSCSKPDTSRFVRQRIIDNIYQSI